MGGQPTSFQWARRSWILNKSQPDLVLVRLVEGNARVKSDAVIAHLDVNGVIWTERQVDIDPIGMGVLDRIEQQLADPHK